MTIPTDTVKTDRASVEEAARYLLDCRNCAGKSQEADMLLALLAEREALRKDAERYRWLKTEDRKSMRQDAHGMYSTNSLAIISWRGIGGLRALADDDHLDALIDAAISAEGR
jgi:uncharacterized ferredoxin-like protein